MLSNDLFKNVTLVSVINHLPWLLRVSYSPFPFPQQSGKTYPLTSSLDYQNQKSMKTYPIPTARSLAGIFLKEVIRLHGIPKTILSDRDPLFLSKFWKEIFKMHGSDLKFSSAYHPETDGQTEVVNRSLETYLRCLVADQPKTWAYWVPWAEFWHNTTYHSSTNTTPFEIVYGCPPPTIFRYASGEVQCEAVQQEL